MKCLCWVVVALAPTVLAKTSKEDKAYAPYNVTCPDVSSLARVADSLSSDEKDWISERDKITRYNLIDWLGKSNLTDFDAGSFLSNKTVRVGLAFSGGGYRAMLAGAGSFAAADNRTANSTKTGHMGGLLQAATYVAGLSGGNWLLSSIVVNNFTSVQELQGSKDLWDLKHSIVAPGGVNIFKTFDYWDDVSDSVHAKQDAGYNTSLTDIWGRALSYQFFNFSEGGSAIRYHYVREYDDFKNHQSFFPVHVTDGRAPDSLIVNTNATVFEFNPFELGSWDPSLYSFTNLQYLGSDVSNGKPTSDHCANGFDNAGFLMGTSSSLFNQFFLKLNGTSVPSGIKSLLNRFLEDLGRKNDDIAIYDPNPFSNITGIDNDVTKSAVLDLVDGGEDGENVPLQPLIQPTRDVDVIFALDNTADTKNGSAIGANWPFGSSLVQTYQRQFSPQGNGTIFPYVPDEDTFLYGGLALQPTFFGCDRENLTSLFNKSMPESDHHYPPVIIYVANSLHSYQSNTSTFKMSYETDEVAGMIENGYNVLTQNNGTIDPEWRTCVACAVILREQQRRGEKPSDQCSSCFSRYCWDGKTKAASSSAKIARRDGKSNIVPNSSATSTSKSSGSKKNSAVTLNVPTVLPALLAAAFYIL